MLLTKRYILKKVLKRLGINDKVKPIYTPSAPKLFFMYSTQVKHDDIIHVS